MMEQEGQQLNEQLQMIEQSVKEMMELKGSLDEIERGKSNDILANLGKRIYIPVEIKDKNLIVEVGRGNFVKKSIPETQSVIDEQIGRLSEGRGQIMGRLGELQGEMMQMVQSFESGKEEKKEK